MSPIDAACPIDAVWNEACGHVAVAQNGLIASDQAAQFYPWRVLVRNLFKQGTLPLWNPYNASGYPLLANAQSSVFYPINLLADLFPIEYSFTVSAVIRLFITGLGTFLLARTLNLSFYGALFSAIAFAFSTPVVVWLGYAIIEVIAFFPWLLYLTERVFKSKNLLYSLATGITFGLMGLAGHPQTLFMSVLVWALYLTARLIILNSVDKYSFERLGSIVLKLALAGVLGLALAAIQLLPTWQMLQDSVGFSYRGQASNPALFQGHGQRGDYLSLILLLWPGFFGNPAWPQVGTGAWFLHRNYNELALYLGFLPLLMLPFAFTHKCQRWVSWLYGGIALVSIGLFLELPLFYAITELSLLEKAASERFRIFMALSLALLAGRGLDSFLSIDRKRLYAGLIFVVTLALSATVGLTGFKLVNHPHYHRITPAQFSLSSIIQVAGELDLPFWDSLAGNPTVVFIVPLVMSLCLVILVMVTKYKPHYLACSLLLLLAIDLYAINAHYNVTNEIEMEASRIAQKSQTITYLQQTMQPTDRLAAFGPILLPNSTSLLGISDVRGYDVMMPRRYYDLFAKSAGHHLYGPGGFFLSQPNHILRLLSTNYFLTSTPFPDKEPAFISDHGLFVYHLPEALPRAFLVTDVQLLPPETIRKTIMDDGFDPATTALIEAKPPAWWISSPGEAIEAASVQITSYQPNRVTLEVDNPTPSFLVLTDGYDVGWNAYVAGERQQLYRTNYVVRGIFLARGHHLVEFSYEPVTFKLGMILTLASLAVTVGVGIFIWWLNNRPRIRPTVKLKDG